MYSQPWEYKDYGLKWTFRKDYDFRTDVFSEKFHAMGLFFLKVLMNPPEECQRSQMK